MTSSCSDHARIMVESVAHWKSQFICFLTIWLPFFGMQFCMAGAVFGEVGGRVLLLCALKMTFDMS